MFPKCGWDGAMNKKSVNSACLFDLLFTCKYTKLPTILEQKTFKF